MSAPASKPRNRIPRKYYVIEGVMHIETSHSQPGDVLHIYKNDFGHLALNMRTQKYCYVSAEMLRDAEIFTITRIDRPGKEMS